MLDRQPAVGTVAHVCVDAEAELVDVEGERFVLVIDVQAHHINTLVHDTSLVDGGTVSLATRRRFSKTAMVRSGRCAAFRTQAGTRSS
jgi:hypothetical protein